MSCPHMNNDAEKRERFEIYIREFCTLCPTGGLPSAQLTVSPTLQTLGVKFKSHVQSSKRRPNVYIWCDWRVIACYWHLPLTPLKLHREIDITWHAPNMQCEWGVMQPAGGIPLSRDYDLVLKFPKQRDCSGIRDTVSEHTLFPLTMFKAIFWLLSCWILMHMHISYVKRGIDTITGFI
jgi:hypothetical protein